MEYDLASVDYILQTTRSVRKRLDLSRPVDMDTVLECLEIAQQAPTGGNAQGWKFLIVTDKEKIAKVGAYYKQSFEAYSKRGGTPGPGNREASDQRKVYSSASYLADKMSEVPMMIFACIHGRVEKASAGSQAGLYGSILPATWSLMLALRARGIGASWTTLHLGYEKECAEILGIPDDYTTAAMLPVAYFTGETFQIAKRLPMEDVTYFDSWGEKR